MNPVNRAVLRAGRLGATYAVLETTGRHSGLPRQIPVANGLEGDIFWLISAHGRHANYVYNLRANPRVRVGFARDGELHWRTGTAHPVSDDDTRTRQSQLVRGRLGYRIDAVLLRMIATDLTTIRIELDPS
ncbi:MAG: nitroreductase/quinone reductase family protein [Solirubrobacteraceae bacterium]